MSSHSDLTAKNHYREDDYFTYNIGAGVIRSPSGTRVITLPDSLLRGIASALEHEAGDAAPIILHGCGKIWGKRFAEHHLLEVRQLFKTDAGQLPFGLFAQTLRRIWSLHGWGNLSMSFDLRELGFVEVFVENALYGSLVGESDRPSEHLWAGLIGAFFSTLTGKDLDATQTSCVSCGAEENVFLVGLGTRVQLIQDWVRKGRSHAEIAGSIVDGALAQ